MFFKFSHFIPAKISRFSYELISNSLKKKELYFLIKKCLSTKGTESLVIVNFQITTLKLFSSKKISKVPDTAIKITSTYQFNEHGALYPLKLTLRLITIWSARSFLYARAHPLYNTPKVDIHFWHLFLEAQGPNWFEKNFEVRCTHSVITDNTIFHSLLIKVWRKQNCAYLLKLMWFV